jgi:type III secretory pathway component EscU
MNPLMRLTRKRSKHARKKNQNAKSHKILKTTDIVEILITFTLAIYVEI